MLKYLLSNLGFGLSMPNLILSVTGGAVQFSIDKETERAFKVVSILI